MLRTFSSDSDSYRQSRRFATVMILWLVAPCGATNAEAGVLDYAAVSEMRVTREPTMKPTPSSGLALDEEVRQLSHHNFVLGIAATGAMRARGSQCGHELNTFVAASIHKEFWALKVLDSFGRPPHSFIWGNYFWLGSQDLCDDLNTPYKITFSDRHRERGNFNTTSPFPMRYTVVYMNFTTPHYINLALDFENFIHVGLCLPASCAPDSLLSYANTFFQRGSFQLQQDFQLHMQAIDVRTPNFDWRIFTATGTVLFLVFLVITIILMASAELVHRSRLRLKRQQELHAKIITIAGLSSLPIFIPPASALATPAATHVINHLSAQNKNPSTLEEVVLCFRLQDNWKRIMRLDRGQSSAWIESIAGLRTIVCLWVTIFHAYYYALYAMSNAPLMFAKLEHVLLQPILQACFYVDVFFIMSAFLLVHNFLGNKEQLQLIRNNKFMANLKLFMRMFIHRYMRFTPVLIVTMLLSDIIFSLLNMYTPFHLDAHSGNGNGIYCSRTWWQTLLYIQNFSEMKRICCSWTWYLACEMQYFVVCNALLFLYAKKAKLATTAFIALATASVAAGWICNYRNGITFQLDVIYSTLDELYIAPWVRAIPYVAGAWLGWLLHRLQHQQPSMEEQTHLEPKHHRHHHQEHQQQQQQPQKQNAACEKADAPVSVPASGWRAAWWLLCLILYVATNFMSYYRHTPTIVVATIMSVGKLLFALGMPGCIIVLCTLGHGRVVRAVLGARPFLFLNKFCYSIYMVAPIIVVAVFGLRNAATNFTEVGSGTDFLAIILLAIAASMVLVLLVEQPWLRVANVLLRQPKRRPK